MARRRRISRKFFGGNRRKRTQRFARNIKRRFLRGRKRGRGGNQIAYRFARQQEVTVYNNENATPDVGCVSSNTAMWGSGIALSTIAPGTFFDPYPGRSATFVGNKTFTAGDTINTTEFSALFDQYKLTKVTMEFDYKNGTADPTPGNANVTPTLHIVTDWDGDQGTSYMSINDMMEHGPSHFKRSLRSRVKYTIRPKVRDAIFNTSGLSAIAIPRSCPWIDTSNMTCKMNGIKWALQDWPLYGTVDDPGIGAHMTQPTLRILFTYHYKFKGVQ